MRPAEREAYRLHGGLPVHRRRVAAAVAVVRAALAAVPGEWGVGCSGGKDSTALLSAALEAGWRGPVYHYWSADTPPENTALVVGLAARFGLALRTAEVPSDWALYDAAGGFFALPETPAQRVAWARAQRQYKQAAGDGAAGLAGLFWGLRAEEGRTRSIVCARHRGAYRAAGRAEATALPLARWTARDVWARHLAQVLPWLPRYDAAPDRGRERSETVWLGFAGPWAQGQGARLRQADPALWSRLVARWPDLSRWG